MAQYPVDSSDWRSALDAIVAATDTNLRAIRGLSTTAGSNGGSPIGLRSTPTGSLSPAATPPSLWTSQGPDQASAYNSAVLGKLQDRQVTAVRGELSSLLNTVQSSLSELRIEVSAAKKLSSNATATLGEQTKKGLAPQLGDTPTSSRLDDLEDQVTRLQRTIRRIPDAGASEVAQQLAMEDGSIRDLNKSQKGLDKKIEGVNSAVEELKDQMAKVSGSLARSANANDFEALEEKVRSLKSAQADLEEAVKRQSSGSARAGLDLEARQQAKKIAAEAVAESEQTMQTKLNGLAKAILEEQEGGVQQRTVTALKNGLQEAAERIDELEAGLSKAADKNRRSSADLETMLEERLAGMEAQLRLDQERNASAEQLKALTEKQEKRLQELEDRLVVMESKPVATLADLDDVKAAAEASASASAAPRSPVEKAAPALDATLELRLVNAERKASAAQEASEEAVQAAEMSNRRLKASETKTELFEEDLDALKTKVAQAEARASAANAEMEMQMAALAKKLQEAEAAKEASVKEAGSRAAGEKAQSDAVEALAERVSSAEDKLKDTAAVEALASALSEVQGTLALQSESIKAFEEGFSTNAAPETEKPSEESAEEHQALLKRLEEVTEMADAFGAQAAALEEKAEAALKAAGEAAEKLTETDALASAVSEVQGTLEKHSEAIKTLENEGSEAKALPVSETDKPSESAEEHQAVLKRLGEIEEKVEEASKAASDAAEKAGKKVRGQDLDKLTLKVNAMANGILALEEEHTEINNRIDAFASGGASGSAGSGKETLGAVSAKEVLELSERVGKLEEQAESAAAAASARSTGPSKPTVETGPLGTTDDDVLLERISAIERCLGELQPSPGASEGGKVPVGDLEAINRELKQLSDAVESIKAQAISREQPDEDLSMADAELRQQVEGLSEQVKALQEASKAAPGADEPDESARAASERSLMAAPAATEKDVDKELKEHDGRLDDLDTRLCALEVKSSLKAKDVPSSAAATAAADATAGDGGVSDLKSDLEELRAKTEESLEDVDITIAGAKRAAMEAEGSAAEALEVVEGVKEKLEEVTSALARQEAAIAGLKHAAPGQEEASDQMDTKDSDAGAARDAEVQGLVTELLALKTTVTELRAHADAGKGPSAASSAAAEVGGAAVTQDELETIVDELSEALMAEIEELKGAVAGLQAQGGGGGGEGAPDGNDFAVLKESLRAMADEIEAGEASVTALAGELEGVKAALAESEGRGTRSMDTGDDTELHAEGTTSTAAEVQGLLTEVAAVKATVAKLQESLESVRGSSVDAEELEELRAAVSELQSARGAQGPSSAEVEEVVEERSRALAADIEALKTACEELRREGEARGDTLEDMSRQQELLLEVEHLTRQSEATISEIEQLQRAVAELKGGQGLAELNGRVLELEGHLEQSETLATELEAVKASVLGLEVGEAGRALDNRSTFALAEEHQPDARGDASALMADVREAQHSFQTLKSSINRDAKVAANAAAQAEKAAAALNAALPLFSGTDPSVVREMAELEEIMRESQELTGDALGGLGQDLREVRAVAEQRLLELRADAESAVEALSELSVANAAAQHSAMSEQYVALQAAEERAAELEGELDNARVQVDSLNSVLQNLEVGGIQGESHSAHYKRQMSYMVGLLQSKTSEVAALRAGAGPSSSAADAAAELEAVQEAFAQESMGSWAVIEEFRDNLMHFETEMNQAMSEVQSELSALREHAKRAAAAEGMPGQGSARSPAAPASAEQALSSDMQSNPMFAQSDESGQADSPGIKAIGTLNSAFSNPMFSADDSLSESPGVDVPEKGDMGPEEEQEQDNATSYAFNVSGPQPIAQLASMRAAASSLKQKAGEMLLEDTAHETSISTSMVTDRTQDTMLHSYVAESREKPEPETAEEEQVPGPSEGSLPQLVVEASPLGPHSGESSETEEPLRGANLPISPAAKTPSASAKPTRGHRAAESDDTASEVGTESINTEVYTEDEEFELDPEHGQEPEPAPQEPAAEPQPDGQTDEPSPGVSVKDRMAMFQSNASEAAATRIPPPPAAAAAAPTKDTRGSEAEASMLSRIPGPPSSSAGLQQDLDAESSHDTSGDLTPEVSESTFHDGPRFHIRDEMGSLSSRSMQFEVAESAAELAQESSSRLGLPSTAEGLELEEDLAEDDDEIEIDYGDGTTEIVRSRPEPQEDEDDDDIEIDYGDGTTEMVRSNPAPAAAAAVPVYGGSGADMDILGDSGAADDPSDDDLGIDIDYGDAQDVPADAGDIMGSIEHVDLAGDRDEDLLSDDDLDAGLDAPPPDLGVDPSGMLGDSDLLMSGELGAEEQELYEEMEEIQAQLRAPGLSAFERETLEMRLQEIEEQLAEPDYLDTSLHVAGTDPSRAEIEILEQIKEKEEQLAEADAFDKELFEIEIDDLKLELRQLRQRPR